MASGEYVCAEYIWIDGTGGLRSKTKVVHGKSSVTLEDLPNWNYDGSSTRQAPGSDSEVVIVPRAIFADPFRRSPTSNHVLVVTDTYTPAMVPIPTNTRALAAKIFEQKPEDIPWFGIEQEYTLFQNGAPLGWPKSKARSTGNPLHNFGYPAPQGPYYCSAGADKAFGRPLVEAHLEHCLYAGLNLSGINAEVMPGQWEYQVGPCVGIAAGDHHMCARYIMLRCAEKFKISVSIDPKPMPGDWNGAGCHTNFSTESMRTNPDSYQKEMIPALKERFAPRHAMHIKNYGTGNELRLTGKHETASMNTFRFGVADRGASIRIGNETKEKGYGYFEDRRPASNMDPYVVTSLIFYTFSFGQSEGYALDAEFDKLGIARPAVVPVMIDDVKRKSDKPLNEKTKAENPVFEQPEAGVDEKVFESQVDIEETPAVTETAETDTLDKMETAAEKHTAAPPKGKKTKKKKCVVA